MSKKTRILYAVIALLSVLGVLTSLYLIRLHYSNLDHVRALREKFPFMKTYTPDPDDPYEQYRFQGREVSCDINEFITCTGVDESEYSELFGIGVAVYGLVGYVLLFLLSLRAVFLGSPKMCLTRLLIFIGASGGFLYTIWLNYVEFFVIGMLCPECTISAVLITAIFVLSLIATDAEIG